MEFRSTDELFASLRAADVRSIVASTAADARHKADALRQLVGDHYGVLLETADEATQMLAGVTELVAQVRQVQSAVAAFVAAPLPTAHAAAAAGADGDTVGVEGDAAAQLGCAYAVDCAVRDGRLLEAAAAAAAAARGGDRVASWQRAVHGALVAQSTERVRRAAWDATTAALAAAAGGGGALGDVVATVCEAVAADALLAAAGDGAAVSAAMQQVLFRAADGALASLLQDGGSGVGGGSGSRPAGSGDAIASRLAAIGDVLAVTLAAGRSLQRPESLAALSLAVATGTPPTPPWRSASPVLPAVVWPAKPAEGAPIDPVAAWVYASMQRVGAAVPALVTALAGQAEAASPLAQLAAAIRQLRRHCADTADALLGVSSSAGTYATVFAPALGQLAASARRAERDAGFARLQRAVTSAIGATDSVSGGDAPSDEPPWQGLLAVARTVATQPHGWGGAPPLSWGLICERLQDQLAVRAIPGMVDAGADAGASFAAATRHLRTFTAVVFADDVGSGNAAHDDNATAPPLAFDAADGPAAAAVATALDSAVPRQLPAGAPAMEQCETAMSYSRACRLLAAAQALLSAATAASLSDVSRAAAQASLVAGAWAARWLATAGIASALGEGDVAVAGGPTSSRAHWHRTLLTAAGDDAAVRIAFPVAPSSQLHAAVSSMATLLSQELDAVTSHSIDPSADTHDRYLSQQRLRCLAIDAAGAALRDLVVAQATAALTATATSAPVGEASPAFATVLQAAFDVATVAVGAGATLALRDGRRLHEHLLRRIRGPAAVADAPPSPDDSHGLQPPFAQSWEALLGRLDPVDATTVGPAMVKWVGEYIRATAWRLWLPLAPDVGPRPLRGDGAIGPNDLAEWWMGTLPADAIGLHYIAAASGAGEAALVPLPRPLQGLPTQAAGGLDASLQQQLLRVSLPVTTALADVADTTGGGIIRLADLPRATLLPVPLRSAAAGGGGRAQLLAASPGGVGGGGYLALLSGTRGAGADGDGGAAATRGGGGAPAAGGSGGARGAGTAATAAAVASAAGAALFDMTRTMTSSLLGFAAAVPPSGTGK